MGGKLVKYALKVCRGSKTIKSIVKNLNILHSGLKLGFCKSFCNVFIKKHVKDNLNVTLGQHTYPVCPN